MKTKGIIHIWFGSLCVKVAKGTELYTTSYHYKITIQEIMSATIIKQVATSSPISVATT